METQCADWTRKNKKLEDQAIIRDAKAAEDARFAQQYIQELETFTRLLQCNDYSTQVEPKILIMEYGVEVKIQKEKVDSYTQCENEPLPSTSKPKISAIQIVDNSPFD